MPRSAHLCHPHPLLSALPHLLAVAAMAGAATLGSALWLSSPVRAGQVEVEFVQPERFSDAGQHPIDRQQVLATLSQYAQTWGKRLPPEQSLKLQVLDLDLAGRIEPWPGRLGWTDVRVLNGRADAPRVQLRYQLLSAGQVLRSGDVQLSDIGYTLGRQHGELAYEKRMLERWFSSNFEAQ